MHGKVQKLVISPILTVFDDNGEVINELQMKNVVIYPGNNFDLKALVAYLEKETNDKFLEKISDNTPPESI